MKNLLRPALAALAALALAGCITYDESGRAMLGVPNRQSPPRQTSPRQVEETRREARLVDLDGAVRRLETEFDGMGASINTVSQKAEAAERQASSQSADLAALKAEIAALRRDLDEQRAALAAIPASFGKLLEENNRALAADVDARVKAASAAAAQAAASARRTSGSSGSSRASSSGKFYEHEVAPGQSLSVIAREYGVSMQEIMDENGLKDASLIRVGQKLLIPVK